MKTRFLTILAAFLAVVGALDAQTYSRINDLPVRNTPVSTDSVPASDAAGVNWRIPFSKFGGGGTGGTIPNTTDILIGNNAGGAAALGSGTGIKLMLQTPTSANIKSAISDDLGVAGGKLIFALGQLNIATGKIFTANNTITLAGTDGSTLNIGNGGIFTALPVGGSTGQVLTKNSTNDYDVTWNIRNPTKVLWLVTVMSSTFTPDAGTRALLVEAIGGGGGSAGALGTATSASVSGGGGGGQYTLLYYSTVAASYNYTIGAGGTAGTATPTAGGAGGDTVFDVMTAHGGLGSAIPTAGTTNVISGSGGAPSNGVCNCDIKIGGGNGQHGIRINGAAGGYGGWGGASFWSTSITSGNLNTPGAAGNVYGGGASGANSSTATGQAGAAGGQGLIKVTEFF